MQTRNVTDAHRRPPTDAELIQTPCDPEPGRVPGDRFDPSRARRVLRIRRVFELAVVLLGLPVWLPTIATCAIVIFLSDGPPVLYRSSRRVYRGQRATIYKFRTMVRNAEALFNRRTVPTESQRFLNIPLDSPAYTRIGRLIERFSLTELPQLVQVLSGTMALVGNRPLPEDVIEALKASFPGVEARFWSRAGVIGPAQLVGRDVLTDVQRLELEIAYARYCLEHPAIGVSLRILVEGILIAARLRPAHSFATVRQLLAR
ncbi:MAG: sugar transferase [Gammaproteobacteria bacterium]